MTKRERIAELVSKSSISIRVSSDPHGPKWMLIRVSGECAKLPSTTNNRLITVPRQGVLSEIRTLKASFKSISLHQLNQLERKVSYLRAMITKNPAHQEQLEALSQLFNSARNNRLATFPVDKKNRAMIYILLSPLNNRMDSHNIPKAVCDWLQEISVLSNDRFVDTFARRKVDMGITTQSSDILIVRERLVAKQVGELLQPMLRILESTEPQPASIQTSLFNG